MSVKLFKSFVNSLRQGLPIYPKTGSHLQFVTAMDVAEQKNSQTEAKDTDEEISNKNATRYKRRYMKRQWDSPKKDVGETEEKKLCDEKGERIKRKKMAMLLGYCGVDYYGMQRNPGVPTIEEDLLKALFDANYITEEDFKNQQNAHFQRSSRTDKGVSAARQVVSLKLPLETKIEEINKRLPECIKVFGVKRVTNKFNSKIKCNARTYSYTLPTYVFDTSVVSEDEKRKYRISAEKLGHINEVLGFYKGAKSYHNFTEKKHHTDPSALRFMMNFSVDKVFVEHDMEFAVLLVKGQSFMLHQIRKMVGLAIAVMRGRTSPSTVERAFGKDKVIIPTAPGLGLVLDMVHYDRYDTKFKDSHDSLTWEAEEPAVDTFKHKYIYPNIVKGEIEGNSIGLWLEKLNRHSFDPTEENPEDKTENEAKEADSDDEAVLDDERDGVESNVEKVNTGDDIIESNVEKVNIADDINESNLEKLNTVDGVNESDVERVNTADDVNVKNKDTDVKVSIENKDAI